MELTRAFIAIELSETAKSAIARVQNRLKTLTPPHTVSWVAPQNIHLTLHFLGEVEAAAIDQTGRIVEAVAATIPPFTVKLGGLGCFPNFWRPRVLWVGLPEPSAPLNLLHRRLGQRLQSEIGFSPENRPFAPHLTLGRVKNGIPARHLTQLGQLIEQEQAQVGILAQMPVTGVCLIKSELKPGGAVYSILRQGQFGTMESNHGD